MKLNLGCGPQVPQGWVNVDYSLGARVMRVPLLRAVNRRLGVFATDWSDDIFLHDLTKPFPWADASVDVVYSSHTLEHLSREEGRRFLAECHRVLRTGGIVRIVVPDLRHDIEAYLEGRVAADDFVERLGVLYDTQGGGLRKRLAPLFQFPHKCMYDTPRLLQILTEGQFDARDRGAFDSDIEDIRAVEDAGRTQKAVIVEGRKR